MLESLNLTIVSCFAIVAGSIIYVFGRKNKVDENSIKTWKKRLENKQEESDEYQKQAKTWSQRYYRLQKQVDEGFDLEGNPQDESGYGDLIQKFLPMIAEVFPQAKGLFGDPATIKIIVEALQAHPDLLKKIIPAILSKKGKKSESSSSPQEQKQVESYNIVS